jgi:hypothetical protein
MLPGGNLFVGRSLAGLLRSIGAENIQIKAHIGIPLIDEYQRTHLLSLVESLHEPMLATGRITLTELWRL